MANLKYFFLSLIVSGLLIVVCKPLGLMHSFGLTDIVIWVLLVKLGDRSIELSQANAKLNNAIAVDPKIVERRLLMTSGVVYPIFFAAFVAACSNFIK